MGAPRLQFTCYLLTPFKSRACHNNQVPWGYHTHTHAHTHTDIHTVKGCQEGGRTRKGIESLKLRHFTYMAGHKGFFSTGSLSYLQRKKQKREETEMENVKCVSSAEGSCHLSGQLVWVHSRLPRRDWAGCPY